MGVPQLSLLLVAALALSGCARSLSSQPPPKWTTGFWFWQGSSAGALQAGAPLDLLFVQTGTIRYEMNRWSADGSWPESLPVAREYWILFRYERQGVPAVEVAPIIAGEVSRLLAAAQRKHLNVAGIQLDIDSPTAALSQYAHFIGELKKKLPEGLQISITALLDWFRNGTSLGAVIEQVDEFVPQFYDLGDPRDYMATSIAARIDSPRWAPVFNRFGKRFRIGISTFGRARRVPKDGPPAARYSRVAVYGDLSLLEIAVDPAFELHSERNAANELVLSYRATRNTRIDYNRFAPGDTMQFILATPEGIRAATASARQIGGNNAGVVFFRWPGADESLAMQPEEALRAAGVAGVNKNAQCLLRAVDRHCAAVACVDVFLESDGTFSPEARRYRIRTSKELDYFLPERNMPVRMSGASELEVTLPPYCARGRLYLGRALSSKRAEFTLKVQP